MSDEEGAEFSLWSGDIHGTNTKVVKHERLEQDWYGGDWAEASKVKFMLSEANGMTTIQLIQTGVPEAEIESIEDGWKQFYIGPLKELLEQ